MMKSAPHQSGNITLIILIIIVLIVGGSAFAYFGLHINPLASYSSPTSQPVYTNPTKTPVQNSAATSSANQNPFDNTSSYQNPFDNAQNPFSNLKQ